jgi:hypothetical protein
MGMLEGILNSMIKGQRCLMMGGTVTIDLKAISLTEGEEFLTMFTIPNNTTLTLPTTVTATRITLLAIMLTT